MINKINFAQGIQQVQLKPAFRANKEEGGNITIPENEVSFKGAEALANYNKPNVMAFDKSILEVEPILPDISQPDEIGSIEGEKIYGSNGKLNSIIDRVGNRTIIYKADPNNEGWLESVTVTDKKTGNIIKKLHYTVEDGKNYVVASEYDAITGKELRTSEYIDGALDYASKTIDNGNGQTTTISFDYKNGHYTVNQDNHSTSTYKSYEFNKNKELINIYENKYAHGSEQYSNVEFYNGAVVSTRLEKTEVIPNSMGREVMSDTDVKPADISIYPDSIDGEKTFYSNGSLESVTAGDLVYNYSPEGDITSIKDGNKTVEVKNNVTTITETLEDGAIKTTQYFNDGDTCIDYIKGDYTKHFVLSNNLPSYYLEENGDRTIKYLNYNEKGMLISAWGDDI